MGSPPNRRRRCMGGGKENCDRRHEGMIPTTFRRRKTLIPARAVVGGFGSGSRMSSFWKL